VNARSSSILADRFHPRNLSRITQKTKPVFTSLMKTGSDCCTCRTSFSWSKSPHFMARISRATTAKRAVATRSLSLAQTHTPCGRFYPWRMRLFRLASLLADSTPRVASLLNPESCFPADRIHLSACFPVGQFHPSDCIPAPPAVRIHADRIHLSACFPVGQFHPSAIPTA
jgi:hypothetical protein